MAVALALLVALGPSMLTFWLAVCMENRPRMPLTAAAPRGFLEAAAAAAGLPMVLRPLRLRPRACSQ